MSKMFDIGNIARPSTHVKYFLHRRRGTCLLAHCRSRRAGSGELLFGAGGSAPQAARDLPLKALVSRAGDESSLCNTSRVALGSRVPAILGKTLRPLRSEFPCISFG